MSDKFKYLMLKDRLDAEFPIIWPCINTGDYRSGISHREVADLHRASAVRVISAGFCELSPEIVAYGRSESMDMESRGIDTEVIARFLTPDPPSADSCVAPRIPASETAQ